MDHSTGAALCALAQDALKSMKKVSVWAPGLEGIAIHEIALSEDNPDLCFAWLYGGSDRHWFPTAELRAIRVGASG
jgi:hypothetical protein